MSKEDDMPSVLLNVSNTDTQAQQGALVLDDFQTIHSPSVTLFFLGCPSRATQISLDMEGNSQIIHTSDDERKCPENSHVRKGTHSDYGMSSVKSSENPDEFELKRANALSQEKEQPKHESGRKHTGQADVQLRPEESRSYSNAKRGIQFNASAREKNKHHDSHSYNVNLQLRRGNRMTVSTAAFPKSDKLNDGEFMGNKTDKDGSRPSPPHIARTERTHTISPRRSTSSTNDGTQRKKSLERSSDGKTAILTSQRVRSSHRGHKHKSEGGRFIDDVDGTNTGCLSVDHLDIENPSPTIVQLIGEKAHGDNIITTSPSKVDVIAGNVVLEKEIISGEDQCVLPKDTKSSDTLQLKPEDLAFTSISQSISKGHRHVSKLRSRNHPTTDKIFIDVMKLLVTQSDPRKPCYCQEVSASEIQLSPSSSLSNTNLYPSSQQFDSSPEVNFSHLQESADANSQKHQFELVERHKHKFPCLKSDPLRNSKTITITSHNGNSYRSQNDEYETGDRNIHNHIDEEQNRCGNFWGISDSEHSSPSGSSRQSFGSSEDVQAQAQTRREEDESEGKHLSVREMVRALQERLETTSQAGSSRDLKRTVHKRSQSASPNSSLNLTRKYLSEFNDTSKKQQNDLSSHMKVHKNRPKEPSRETHSLFIRVSDNQEDLEEHVEKSTETQEEPTEEAMTQTSDLAVGQAVGIHVTEAGWESPLNKNKKKASRIPIKRHIAQLSKLILKSSERIRNQFTTHPEVGGTSQTDTMVVTPAKDCISALQEKIIGKTDVIRKNEDNATHLVNKINIIITPPSPTSMRAKIDGYKDDDEPIGWSECKNDCLQIPETSTCPLTQHPDMALMERREQQMIDDFRKQTKEIESDSPVKRQLLVDGVSPLLKSFATDTRALLFGTQKSLSGYLKKARAVLTGPQPTLINETKSNEQVKDNVCEMPTFYKIPRSLSSSDLLKSDQKITSECQLQPDSVYDLRDSSADVHVTTQSSGTVSLPKAVSETELIMGDAHPPIYCLRINDISRVREDTKPTHRCDPFRGNAALRKFVFECKQVGPSARSNTTVGKSQTDKLKQNLSNEEDVMKISVSYDEKSSKKICEKNDHPTSTISEEDNKKNQEKICSGLITEREEIELSSFRFCAPRLECTEKNSPPYLQSNEGNSGVDSLKNSALDYNSRDSSHVISNCAVPTEQTEESKLVLQSCASCSDCKRDSDNNSLQDDVSSLAPIKSLSLVNAADAGHTDPGVTDVIALLSPEVNIKRYPSFPDLTDIHDENNPLMGAMEGGPPVKIPLGIERTTDEHYQSDESECTRQSINQTRDQLTVTLSEYLPKCQHPFSLVSIEEEKVTLEPFSKSETTNVKKPANEGHPQTKDNILHNSVNLGIASIRSGPMHLASKVSKLNTNAYSVASNSEEYQSKESKESHLVITDSKEFESAASSRNSMFNEHELPSPPDHSLSDTSKECDQQDWIRGNDSSDDSIYEMQVDKAQSTSKATKLPKPVGWRDHLGRLRAAVNEHYYPLTVETSSVQGLHSMDIKQLFADSELSQSSQIFDSPQTVAKENSISLDCSPEMMTIHTHVKHNQADGSLPADGKPGQKHFAECHSEDTKFQSLNQRALTEKVQNEADVNYDENIIFKHIPNIPNVDTSRTDEHELNFHHECRTYQKYTSASQEYPDSRKTKGLNDTAAQNTNDFNKSRSFQRLDEKGYCIFNVCERNETKDSGIIENTATDASSRENKETPDLLNADNTSSILATAVGFPWGTLPNTEDNQTVDICPKPPRPRKQITCNEDILSNQRDDLGHSLISSGDESVSDKSNSCLQDEDSRDDANGERSSFTIRGSELGDRDVPVAKSSGIYNIHSRNITSDKLDRAADVKCTARLPRPTMPLTFKEGKQKPLRCNVNNNVSVVCSEVHCGKVACKKHVQKQRSVCLHLNRAVNSASGSTDHTSDSILDPKSSVPRNYMITSVSKIIGATDQDDSYDQSVTRNVNVTTTTDIDISYSVYSSLSDFIHTQEQHSGTESTSQSPTARNSLRSTSCHFSIVKESSGAHSEMTSTPGDALTTGFSSCGLCKSAFTPSATEELFHSEERFFFHNHCGGTESITPNNNCQIKAISDPMSKVFSSVGCDLILSDTQSELKDRMSHTLSQRIQSSGKDITKAFNFMSRSQRHLDKCDELINRSSKIISMSQETVRHSQKVMEYTAKAMNLSGHTSLVS